MIIRGTSVATLFVQVKNGRDSDGNIDVPSFDVNLEEPAVPLLDACVCGFVNIFFIKSVPVKMLKTLPPAKKMVVHS